MCKTRQFIVEQKERTKKTQCQLLRQKIYDPINHGEQSRIKAKVDRLHIPQCNLPDAEKNIVVNVTKLPIESNPNNDIRRLKCIDHIRFDVRRVNL